jgi:prepilin-type N-terminal cleavage/methylation domain-containing protein
MRPVEEHGFTLIEVLVTMAIAVVVLGATLAAFDVFQQQNVYDRQRNETQDAARTAIDRLARQLRNVVSPTQKAYGALERAEAYSIVFQTVDTSGAENGQNEAHAMRVRYCLDDSTPTNEALWTQAQKWESKEAPAVPSTSSCPATLSSGGWETKTQLVSHLTNDAGGQSRHLFAYGPPSATEPSEVISVEVSVYLNVNPGRRPGETELTTGIDLRNANRQPIASFTITEVNGHLELNASESRDPGGLALGYQWWMDSVEQSTTAQRWSTEKLTEGSTHTFKLAVTNPGGLENSIEHTYALK